MAGRFDMGGVGAPAEGEEHRHRKLRAGASLVAAVAGGIAVLIVAMLAIGGVGPSGGNWAWIALPFLCVLWLTGLWWRWDSPDRRLRNDERERRGF